MPAMTAIAATIAATDGILRLVLSGRSRESCGRLSSEEMSVPALRRSRVNIGSLRESDFRYVYETARM